MITLASLLIQAPTIVQTVPFETPANNVRIVPSHATAAVLLVGSKWYNLRFDIESETPMSLQVGGEVAGKPASIASFHIDRQACLAFGFAEDMNSARVEIWATDTPKLRYALARQSRESLFGTSLAVSEKDQLIVVGSPVQTKASEGTGRLDVYQLRDGAHVRAILGTSREFGQCVCFVGDVDGDGAGDCAVAEPGYGGRGRVVVVSVISGKTVLAIDAPSDPAIAQFGAFVRSTERCSEDGQQDLLVSMPSFGDSAPSLAVVDPIRAGVMDRFGVTGAAKGLIDCFLSDAYPAGDVNRDGTCDWYLAWSQASTKGKHEGQVELVSGKDGASLSRFVGKQGLDYLGTSIWSPSLARTKHAAFLVAGTNKELVLLRMQGSE